MENGYHIKGGSFGRATSAPGVASRTPISFIEILDDNMLRILSDFEKIRRVATNDYLNYLYRKWLGKGWYSFVFFQGARSRGRFIAEIGVSRRKSIPYFWNSMLPDYSVDAVRERLPLIMEMENDFFTYKSERDLKVQIKDLLTDFVGSGIHTILDERRDKAEVELNLKLKLVNSTIKKIEEQKEEDPIKLFPDAFKINEIFEYAKKHFDLRSYFRLFPKELQRMTIDPKFQTIFSRVMSEIVSQPRINEFATAKNKKSLDFLDDQIYWLTGRIPVERVLDPLEDLDEQVMNYGYIKEGKEA